MTSSQASTFQRTPQSASLSSSSAPFPSYSHSLASKHSNLPPLQNNPAPSAFSEDHTSMSPPPPHSTYSENAISSAKSTYYPQEDSQPARSSSIGDKFAPFSALPSAAPLSKDQPLNYPPTHDPSLQSYQYVPSSYHTDPSSLSSASNNPAHAHSQQWPSSSAQQSISTVPDLNTLSLADNTPSTQKYPAVTAAKRRVYHQLGAGPGTSSGSFAHPPQAFSNAPSSAVSSNYPLAPPANVQATASLTSPAGSYMGYGNPNVAKVDSLPVNPSMAIQSNTVPYSAQSQTSTAAFSTPSAASRSQGAPRAEPIDRRQLPNPVTVRYEDQASYDKITFSASSKDPYPMSVTDFKAYDDGNSNPKFIRTSVREFPCTDDLVRSTKIPCGVIFQPYASLRPDEGPVPFVDYGNRSPIRCEKCRGYLNPFVTFIEGGRKFICNLCRNENLVPPDYFCELDATGRRCDILSRPELLYGTIDMTTTSEYANRRPLPPVLLFLIDVSATAVKTGLTASAVRAVKFFITSQESNPCPERVAIMTFDRNIHFYPIEERGNSSKMVIVSDIEDPFIPIVKGVLYKALSSESIACFLKLLDNILNMFLSTSVTHACLGSALDMASKTMESSGGRIVAFQSILPNLGYGILGPREEGTVASGTRKERSLYLPQTYEYQRLGESFSHIGVSVDLFVCSTLPFVDLVTLGLVCSTTGGKSHFYPSFRSDKDGYALMRDLQWSLYKPFMFDALARVRVSDGLTVFGYVGNFHMRNATDVEFARIDSDTTFSVELEHDGKFNEKDRVYIQLALLYTDRFGRRLLRLLNLSLPTTVNPQDVYRSADMDSFFALMIHTAIDECATWDLSDIRTHLLERTVQLLRSYRKLCSAHTAGGQLVLPEAFRLLPIYAMSLVKSKVFRESREITVDKRVHLMRCLNAMPCSRMMIHFYPRLYKLQDLVNVSDEVEDYHLARRSMNYTLSYGTLDTSGIYLLDAGIEIFIWIGNQVSTEDLQALFGVSTIDQIPVHSGFLPSLATKLSRKSVALVSSLEMAHQTYLPLHMCRQQLDPLDVEFASYMVEDRVQNVASYVDFLCQLHNQIQKEL